VKENKIHHNQCGGISLLNCPVGKSVIEYNNISFNSGPGIYEEYSLTKRKENKLQDNKESINSTKRSEIMLLLQKDQNDFKEMQQLLYGSVLWKELPKK
jgi:hypothetical protein